MRNGYKNEKLVLVFGFLATVCCCCCCCCSTSKVKIYAAPAWTERLVRDFVATFQFKATTTTTTATITTTATSICNWNFIWFRFSTIFVDSKAFALCFRIVSVVVNTSFELSCACACVCASSLYALISIMIARLFSQILSFVFIRTRISLLSIFLYLSLSHSVCACVCVWLMALGFFKECSQSVATWLLSARTPASPTLPLYLPLALSPSRRRSNEAAKNIFVNGTFWFSLAFALANLCTTYTHHARVCVCVSVLRSICENVELKILFLFLFLLLIKWKEDAHCGAGLGAPWKSRDKVWSPFCIIEIYDDLY